MRSFDYVIVGAGTAGCVLAARLSADPEVTVLLLEAGTAFPDGDSGWHYRTVPQADADRATLSYPLGKALGGSSRADGLMAGLGDPDSYDAWAEAGATDWTYAALLPFLGAGAASPVGPPVEPLWAATVEAGHHPQADRDALPAGEMLAAIAQRPNLTVLPDAQAVRVVVDRGDCRGVAYHVDGHTGLTCADREVVLATGAIGSPRLLLLSGIGPGADLRANGLPVVADLPGVGSNLQDHPRSQVAYAATGPVPADRAPHMLARTDPDGPQDLHLTFGDRPLHPRHEPGEEDGYSVVFALTRPASRGTVRLRGPDPYAPPLIDPALLADDADVDRMVTGLRMARDLGGAPALSSVRDTEEFPGSGVDSAAVLAQYVRDTVTPCSHPAGTCRMGIDGAAVVDPELRVHAVDGLRVADASVVPSIVTGNTHTATLAVAERAARLISG
ncbi:GMC family oxidoreductase [Asanoa siamensis]|uniref:Choline dehydrogenase n=1 Tax=Asanoa siamensis TaxID=926357 RepID=A0ABQ4CRR1_9ACTN|nr:GMC oxidoreductase [Asanoa siamensis]GIF73975.1 choline dehydrogenase [Asanoa siamensis]